MLFSSTIDIDEGRIPPKKKKNASPSTSQVAAYFSARLHSWLLKQFRVNCKGLKAFMLDHCLPCHRSKRHARRQVPARIPGLHTKAVTSISRYLRLGSELAKTGRRFDRSGRPDRSVLGGPGLWCYFSSEGSVWNGHDCGGLFFCQSW